MKDNKIKEDEMLCKLRSIIHNFGHFLGLEDEEIETMNVAAKFLNIGKKLIHPDDDFKYHPILGSNLMRDFKLASEDSILIVLQRHEKSDGSGYPDKLKDDEINKLSKIVTICDEYLKLRKDESKENSIDKIRSMDRTLNKELLNSFLSFVTENDLY